MNKKKAQHKDGQQFILQGDYTETDPLIGWFSLAKTVRNARPQKRGKEGRR